MTYDYFDISFTDDDFDEGDDAEDTTQTLKEWL